MLTLFGETIMVDEVKTTFHGFVFGAVEPRHGVIRVKLLRVAIIARSGWRVFYATGQQSFLELLH